MLLEFSCSNYKAIKEKIVFSMVAGSDKSHQEELYEFDDYRVSRITSVYGANGAGKSTLIDAVGYLGFLVRECVKFQEGDKIPRTPHKLSAEKPTAFDIQFVVDGIRYAYGFSMNDVEFLDEYLYHFPSGRQAKIFEREGTKFSYGIKYKKELSQLESKTKSNKLFLTTAEAWCSLKEIIHPFRFFKEELIVHGIGPDNWFEYSAEQIRTNSGMKQILVVFMQKIGIPIKDIQVKIENRQLTTQDMPLELLNKVQMLTGMGSLQTIEVKFVYKDYILNINEESQGTQKLFKLLCPFIDVLVNGKVLFYDELEASLHPALVDELIHTFKNWKSEKNPQLIFSSHDTSLLDLDLFRRDQIWFAERNPGLCTTEYYSLVELKNIRKDDNIKKGYINGRYSTIPLKGSSLIEVLGGE